MKINKKAYQVVKSYSAIDLSVSVHKDMMDGWSLAGGISVIQEPYPSGKLLYVQALVNESMLAQLKFNHKCS